jgi:hypothetical protein
MKEQKKEVVEYIKNAIKHETTPAVMTSNLAEIFARHFNEAVAPALPKRFKKVLSKRWQQPAMNGYLMKCCDCGLVHSVDFRIAYGKSEEQNRVQLRMKRL